MLEHIFADCGLWNVGLVLSGQDNFVDPLGHAVLVLNGYLGLTVRPQIGSSPSLRTAASRRAIL